MTAKEIALALAAPFGPEDIKWKPQATSGQRALAIAYISSRAVMDRLDGVVGIDSWCDEYEPLADGAVRCRLSLRIDGHWITKEDVGGQSEQPDEGDRRKAAFSDALKRAAVKWGIGRFLYRLPAQWVGYDPQKRQFTETPRLPAGGNQPSGQSQARREALQAEKEQQASARASIEDTERRLVRGGFCQPDEFVDSVHRKLMDRFGENMNEWGSDAAVAAHELAKPFAVWCVSELLSRTGQHMNRLLTKFNLPDGTALRDLSWQQLADAVKCLNEMPAKEGATA